MERIKTIDLKVGDIVFAYLDDPKSLKLEVVSLDLITSSLITRPTTSPDYVGFLVEEDGTITFPLDSGLWQKAN